MSTSAKLIGKTERETVLSELNWMAGWSQSLLRHLRLAYSSMLHCSSMGGPTHDYGEDGPDPATMDALICHLRGTLDQLNNAFEMHYYQTNEGLAIWKHLEKTFTELKRQGMGIIPIPVEETPHDAKVTKEVGKTDAGVFRHLILEVVAAQQKLQNILNKYYDKKTPTFPHLQVQIKLVDANGNDVKTPDFDIEKIIKDHLMSMIESTPPETAQMLTPKVDAPTKK